MELLLGGHQQIGLYGLGVCKYKQKPKDKDSIKCVIKRCFFLLHNGLFGLIAWGHNDPLDGLWSPQTLKPLFINLAGEGTQKQGFLQVVRLASSVHVLWVEQGQATYSPRP